MVAFIPLSIFSSCPSLNNERQFSISITVNAFDLLVVTIKSILTDCIDLGLAFISLQEGYESVCRHVLYTLEHVHITKVISDIEVRCKRA